MTTDLASQKAYFERLDASKFRADAPCDTGMTWMMLDNLAHCVDSSHQYRVNFVDPVGMYFFGAGGNLRGVFSGLFPVTIARDGRWPNFHVKVAAMYQASTSYVMQVRFGLATPAGPLPVRSTGPGVLGYRSATMSGGAPVAWVIDDFIEDVDPDNAPLSKVTIPGVGGGTQSTSQHVMARWTVELELENNEGPGSGYLHGVQVREYPSS